VIRTVSQASEPVLPPSALDVRDDPDEHRLQISLRFLASPHHPGSSGTQATTDPLTGYEVLYAAAGDSGAAQLYTGLALTEVSLGAGDTVRTVIAAPDTSTSYYYWVRAVINDRRSPLAGPNLGRPVNNLLAQQGDLNGDRLIDIFDISTVAQIYGVAAEYDPVYDLSGNGEIDIFDVSVISGVFGQSISAP
jgi:hypothetical protein